MMRSMYSGVSGLRVHQTKMDVISNNIANVNTIGFKSSRITFQEVFSQTLSSATKAAANGMRGGVNASQIGLGTKLASIDIVMSSGVPQRTDSPYDIMIDGEGFLIMSDSAGTYFTRAGSLRFDTDGNLTGPTGLLVNGWIATNGTEPGTQVINKGKCEPIRILAEHEYVNPEETSYIRAEGNLNYNTEKSRDTTTYFFDTLGNRYTLDMRYEYNEASKEWDISIGNYMIMNGDENNKIYITVEMADTDSESLSPVYTGEVPATGYTPKDIHGNNPYYGLTIVPVAALPESTEEMYKIGSVIFNDKGHLLTQQYITDYIDDPNNQDLTNPMYDADSIPSMTSMIFNVQANDVLNPLSSFAENITFNFQDITQFNGAADLTNRTRDGNAPGSLNAIAIGSDGIITGSYSNGETKMIAQIALANFKNPAGLMKVGDNLFIATRNSGDFDGVGASVDDLASSLLGGVLEMANVDLAYEFTEMITAQRGFQANSRIITTSDDMLQELVNLKR